MKKIAFLWVLIYGVLPFYGSAQSNVLDQYIEEGLSNNLSLKQQDLELEKALNAIDIARTNYFPRLDFAPNYSVALGGRAIEIPIGDLLNPVYNTLNQLTGSQAFPNVENAKEQLMPMNFHDTKLEFKLPLFNTDIKYNIALQKDLLGTEQAKRKFLEYELKHAITSAYYQYLQSLEAVKIFEGTIDLLEKNLELNRRLVANEVALKDVVLSAEYDLSKAEQMLNESQKNSRVAAAYFNFLLNRELTTAIIADNNLIQDLPPVRSLSAYTSKANLSRPELYQLNTGLKTQQTLTLLQEKNRLTPEFYLGSNFGFQGFGYKFKDQAYLVGQVGMSWPIYSGGEKKLKIQQSKIAGQVINTQMAEVRKQIEMQVFQQYQELQNSIENLKSKQTDVDRTETIYKMVESRYKNGAAIYMELNKAENDRLTARLSQSLGKMDVWLKYAELLKVSAID